MGGWARASSHARGCGRYSDDATRGRNSGIFWSLLQLSLVIGSVTAMVLVPPGTTISEDTAGSLYTSLLVACAAGTALTLALAEPGGVTGRGDGGGTVEGAPPSARELVLEGVRRMGRALRDRRLLLVIVLVGYSGVELAFWQGKYPAIVAGNDPMAPGLPAGFEPRLIAFMMITGAGPCG